MIEEDPELAECFLEHPIFDEEGKHPFHFSTIREYQQKSNALKQRLVSDPHRYKSNLYGGEELICHRAGDDQDYKIALSDEMLKPFIRWYHLATAHSEGQRRLERTLGRNFYHPRLGVTIREEIEACETCQKDKSGSKQYGLLAPREAPLLPWQEVHTDCIGPWKFKLRTRQQKELEFNALTSIDPVTNLLEINSLIRKTSDEVSRVFENNWLSRYPRPLRCIHDQGPEFMGMEFQALLKEAGVQSVPTTARNPQGNSIIEAIHKSVGQVIRTLVQVAEPTSAAEANALVQRALATAMHATRCASSEALNGLSPGAVAFHRDMHLDIPLIADIITLQANRQRLIDRRLLKANSTRIRHDYKVGEQVLKRNVLSLSDKLQPRFKGPYIVSAVHTNGTVTVKLNDVTTERLNIRRVKPYKDKSSLVKEGELRHD